MAHEPTVLVTGVYICQNKKKLTLNIKFLKLFGIKFFCLAYKNTAPFSREVSHHEFIAKFHLCGLRLG